ncbi:MULTISPECIES: chaperone NapD [unclassified Ruegeria]|uniref:chaperone NapD n=1 Tax=unclassified Ruegeria TaxID=2625375 RepID=UPI0014879AB0|nr:MULTISPECIES: chaperone NapD [unclassified Ruegeria]NOD64344.1 nitrate reductase [Ruegeria sp. HKCCD6109]NOD76938.1 nitrate reductase [Ruegeria sp. HKCCD4332]NOD88461.1 nitrate reductase [Ruegeria sp. HKCCD4318]NOD94716.1 nitrate reductase [Ruegeria sp. HKCCD4884]NOE13370.1 nitrate reductase [Ruegeria sp. HKCCD4318-2]
MNICGCLVHIAPDHTDAARAAMTGTQGVEVHAEAEDGRFVVVVEDTADRLASETIMDLHQIPGVISLSLTYHHFEDLAEASPQSNAQSQPTSRRPMQ